MARPEKQQGQEHQGSRPHGVWETTRRKQQMSRQDLFDFRVHIEHHGVIGAWRGDHGVPLKVEGVKKQA